MLTSIRQTARVQLRAGAESLPSGLSNAIRATYIFAKTPARKRSERIFCRASPDPQYLPAGLLDELAGHYPTLPDYGYSPTALEVRGRRRAAELLALPGVHTAATFLELGCWDGMVSWALQQHGKSTIAIDVRSEGFDRRAFDAGVDLRQMNAESLTLPDASVDVAFSYDAFEHFPHPDRVLGELARVVRSGGFVYLDFGPLYLSPFGEHAYRSIPVPYCQILWSGDVLNDYARRRGVPEIDFLHVNRWRIGQFRRLIADSAPEWTVLKNVESFDLHHLDLIRKYSGRFRAETSVFEDLIVKNVRLLLRRV